MNQDLTGRTILILAGPDFEDHELIYPRIRFIEAGATVKVAGIGETQYTGKHGIPVTVDGQCEDYVNQHWDAVIIPGGWAPDKIRMNQAALEIVRQASQNPKAVVASICHGGWVLCSADVLRGKRATSYVAIKDDMINAGATWVDEEVTVDGNLITSRKPDDLPAFCQQILAALAPAKTAVGV